MNRIPAQRCSTRRRALLSGSALAAALVLAAPTLAMADDGSCSDSASAACPLTSSAVGQDASTGDSSTGDSGATLAWAPPALEDPTTLRVPADGQLTHLDKTQDYRLLLGSVHGTLHIDGGHNVVLIGGQVDAGAHRDAYFQNQTGTLHVEGVKFTSTQAHEGIDLAEPKAVVQLENLDMGQVNGKYSTHHADLLQTWAGPKTLRVDRFEGRTTYQGFFLLPGQHTKVKGPWDFDLRHVVTRDASSDSKYHYWFPGSPSFHLSTTDVVAVKTHDAAASQTIWNHRSDIAVVASAPSPLSGDPGEDYTSPGYRDAGGGCGPGTDAGSGTGTSTGTGTGTGTGTSTGTGTGSGTDTGVPTCPGVQSTGSTGSTDDSTNSSTDGTSGTSGGDGSSS